MGNELVDEEVLNDLSRLGVEVIWREREPNEREMPGARRGELGAGLHTGHVGQRRKLVLASPHRCTQS
jgi:hypothetical protein